LLFVLLFSRFPAKRVVWEESSQLPPPSSDPDVLDAPKQRSGADNIDFSASETRKQKG